MKKGIVLFMSAVIVLAICLKTYEITSDTARHTKEFIKQWETNQRTEGTFSSLIPFEYDQMIVFNPSMTKQEMVTLLGFQDVHIKESEDGMHNIVFIKENKITAYLYGYHSFQVIIPDGKYNQSQINKMTYTQHHHVYTIITKIVTN
ncbi:MAG: hypothetical protein J6K75_08815 [Erysipelotrichaceae bacterium]|nr:hypothetical protein [Erysipelotrichaceae bacterium]